MPNNLYRQALKAALKHSTITENDLNNEQTDAKGLVTLVYTTSNSRGNDLYSATVSVPGLKDAMFRDSQQLNQYLNDKFGVMAQVSDDFYDRQAKDTFRNTLKQAGIEVRETEIDVS